MRCRWRWSARRAAFGSGSSGCAARKRCSKRAPMTWCRRRPRRHCHPVEGGHVPGRGGGRRPPRACA
ncbi:hypothetical protein BU14_1280s0003 [Porphyra umbilicalis]|uniref:Uncharacterized protein n=1 Tax=Porphyra umbilicalis TaxID=2786 RepID=A0A1X6NMU7_PORUM|nr:hypothetical protein BU14_1280s0003 [Porphyra umbilicalis]|eukprot:OSX69683.1 hypothetical protein BU14_1280s0003 [Porphyra umbilicalis]